MKWNQWVPMSPSEFIELTFFYLFFHMTPLLRLCHRWKIFCEFDLLLTYYVLVHKII